MSECGICSSKSKALVSSAPIKDLMRKLNKAEQEKRREERKYQKRFNRIQKREKIKLDIEDITIRCEVVLKPSFKTVTQNLIEDKTKLKKIQQEKSDKNQSVMSHHRKNERMKKYLHQVKYDAMLKKEAFRNLDFNLIDSRVLETKEYLQVQMWEFEGLLKSLSSADLQSSSFIPYNPLSRISRDEDDVDNDELLKVAKLIRLQQFMTCLNSMLGPGTAPLPAQMPPKICFKLKPQTLMAGVKLNIDEGTMKSHLRPEIICSIPFSENNAPWVEEDDIIDEGWESLEITEAGDVVTSGQSSYLSSLWTWATSNPS